jgi:hypothetical protein
LLSQLLGMKVRLTRKHADRIDGVDLTGCQVGDVVDLAPPEATLLVAEEPRADFGRKQGI